MKLLTITVLTMAVIMTNAWAESAFQADTIPTSGGALSITFIGHGTLMFTWNDTVVHVDPWTRLADYDTLPDADIVLVTHEHGDHLDTGAIDAVSKDGTVLVYTEAASEMRTGGIVMRNGDTKSLAGLNIEAVPAYNIVNKRDSGEPFHPKGRGNGYIVTFGDKRIYIAGDTENTPEMKALKDIDIAFLPMNLPYTMTPEMVVDAAMAFRPRILYPYHYGETDTSKLVELLKGEKNIEVRIRDLK